MAKVFIEESTLTAIGDAIREKEGSTELVPVNDMASRISAIPNGGLGIEIEITSTISNASELKNILFKNISNHWCSAVLSKPKNNTLVNNQVVYLSSNKKEFGVGWRFRDGNYANIYLTTSYNASVTIGDIYTIYDLGEAQYDN